MARKVTFATGELYHLYNRGTEKRKIFMSAADYERFIALLFSCNGTAAVRLDDLAKHANSQGSALRVLFDAFERGKTLVDLCAYCLMPNHFHLLAREKEEGGISRFMQKLTTGYTMYFNTRHERSGSLFQGRFKAAHVDNDEYLKYLVSYIHLNPVKLLEPKWRETGIVDRARAKRYLDTYRYSSFPDYSGDERPEQQLLTMRTLYEYYDCTVPASFKASVAVWLDYAEENKK